MQTTTLYTIGTALGRARGQAVTVRVLVSGHWIEGRVSDLDGQGVVIAGDGASHSVVRIQDISAVQVEQQDPLAEQPNDSTEAWARGAGATPADPVDRVVHVLHASR